MITKTQIDVSDLLNDSPFRIMDKRDLLRISQRDVVDIIDQLTSTFIKSFRSGDTPNTAHRYKRYTLRELTVHTEPGCSKTIIDGHELVVTLALLVMYLYRNISDADCRKELKRDCEFAFDRLYPHDEDNWDSRLASAAIMTGYKPDPGCLSDISSHLLLLFDDIEKGLTKTLPEEALAVFGAWLPNNVLMDCVESRCEHGKRLLVSAYAHELRTGKTSH